MSRATICLKKKKPGAQVSGVLRLYCYKGLLAGRRATSAKALQEAREILSATLKRDPIKLRDQLGMPISFDRARGGYVMDGGHACSELPGPWKAQKAALARVNPNVA